MQQSQVAKNKRLVYYTIKKDPCKAEVSIHLELSVIQKLNLAPTFPEKSLSSEGKVAYYIQGGPAFVHDEAADDTETQFSGKIGASVGVSEDLAVYAEVSGISNEDATGDDIIDFGGKLGAKFVF